MEYKTKIHKADEELPQASGEYLTKRDKEYSSWQVLGYSARYRKFNAYDCLNNADNAVEVDLWAELPIKPINNPVSNPSHYQHGGIETKEIIRTMLTPEEYRGYCKGNIIKYRERAEHKGNAEQDYGKAREYMKFLKEVE